MTRRQRLAEDLSDDPLGIEVRGRDLARGAAVPLVIGVDGVQSGRGLLDRPESEQALPVGAIRAGAGMLHHRGLPTRLRARRPSADPVLLPLSDYQLCAPPVRL